MTTFAEQLISAEGRSEFVIVVIADIRGFSAFSTVNESPNIAMFIKRFYLQLINHYFPQATFVKPTGDGLLMTFRYDEKTLAETAEAVLTSCVQLLQEFPTICSDDPMINFTVPQSIGFGVARGTACCLHSGDDILDYSGHLLNLAARLNDFARPSGIVIDGQFLKPVIPESLRENFKDEQVFVRSIAEDAPIRIFYLENYVQISETSRQPLTAERWQTKSHTVTIKDMKKTGVVHLVLPLPRTPKGKSKIKMRFAYPHQNPTLSGMVNSQDFPHFEFDDGPSGPRVLVNLKKAVELAASLKLKQSVPITFQVQFVPKAPPTVPSN